MHKNPIEKIQIVEPPIGELTKKHFTWRRSCFTSCTSVCIFIIILFLGIRLFVGTGPNKLKSLPNNFPTDIPLYDKDNVESIISITGQYKTRGIAIAAFFPRLILSPLFFTLNDAPSNGDQKPLGAWQILTAPVKDTRQTIRIEWRNLNAEATFVTSYYKNELKKIGYRVSNETNSYQEKQFDFQKDTQDGTFYVHADPGNKTGSDFAALTIHVPTGE